MEFTPFTLEQATDIWDDFEDLKDTEFTLKDSQVLMVDDVVICPFNEAEKNEFAKHYLESKNGREALDFYAGNEYDVLLVASNPDATQQSFMDIRTYAKEKGVIYKFPDMND